MGLHTSTSWNRLCDKEGMLEMFIVVYYEYGILLTYTYTVIHSHAQSVLAGLHTVQLWSEWW